MIKKIKKITSVPYRIAQRFFGKNYQMSYSQCGEDLIIRYIFRSLGISKPTYIDIGTNDPIKINNTYLFYKNGSRGILIEPNQALCPLIKKKRSKDICLNIGVAIKNSETTGDLYIMSSHTLSTFSKEEAEKYVQFGSQKIKEIAKVKLVPLNAIIKKYGNGTPNLISLDTEGLDLQILQSLNWDKYRPEVVCVETLTYTENQTEQKIPEILEFMKNKNYGIYADTYINTIFVDKNATKRIL
jgi:FkbM family methyltransferase